MSAPAITALLDVLISLWLVGVLVALYWQARSLEEIPPLDESPALIAVILALAWPATLVAWAIENRREWLAAFSLARKAWKLGRWDPAEVAAAKRRLQAQRPDDYCDDPTRDWRIR